MLQLPLLTVKVDIAHGGKEVVEDDHKFINERLLNLSLPEYQENDSSEPLPLEACLEGRSALQPRSKTHELTYKQRTSMAGLM